MTVLGEVSAGNRDDGKEGVKELEEASKTLKNPAGPSANANASRDPVSTWQRPERMTEAAIQPIT